MKLSTIPFQGGTKCRIECSKCKRILADYIVYIYNGLVDPEREFRNYCKVHRCWED
jgi:hypothetical protein